jgi:hypothetical protein
VPWRRCVDEETLQIRGLTGDARVLQRVGDHDSATFGLGVEERFADRDRHLMLKRRRGLAVTENEEIHGAQRRTRVPG